MMRSMVGGGSVNEVRLLSLTCLPVPTALPSMMRSMVGGGSVNEVCFLSLACLPVPTALPSIMRSMVGGGSVNEVRPAVPLMGGPADVIFSFSRRRYKTAGLCA